MLIRVFRFYQSFFSGKRFMQWALYTMQDKGWHGHRHCLAYTQKCGQSFSEIKPRSQYVIKVTLWSSEWMEIYLHPSPFLSISVSFGRDKLHMWLLILPQLTPLFHECLSSKLVTLFPPMINVNEHKVWVHLMVVVCMDMKHCTSIFGSWFEEKKSFSLQNTMSCI